MTKLPENMTLPELVEHRRQEADAMARSLRRGSDIAIKLKPKWKFINNKWVKVMENIKIEN